MRFLVYVVIVVIMLVGYLCSPEIHLLPGIARYAIEILSLLIVLYVFSVGVGQQFRNVGVKYWLVFGALLLVIALGPIINQEPVGPIIAGARYYLRSIPLFFVPAVFNFSERNLKRYLKLILALTLLQFPTSAYQRITGVARGEFTGDIVVGTLGGSGVVTLFVICVLCYMVALLLRGRMSKFWFTACFVPLLITVSINETKVTVFLLPIALLITFLVSAAPGRRLRGVFQGIAALMLASLIFVPLYNNLNKKNDGTQYFKIQDFISDPSTLERYMSLNAGVGTGKEAGRGDALVAPFRALSSDPIRLAFGFGLGNVSKSNLGAQYGGRYELEYWIYALVHSMSAFLFEIGIFGTALVLLLHWLILKDALYVSKHDKGLIGVLALGFVGAWVTVTFGLFYSTVHTFESISFLFWFFAGLFAAQRQRLVLSRMSAKSSYYAPMAPIGLKQVSAPSVVAAK